MLPGVWQGKARRDASEDDDASDDGGPAASFPRQLAQPGPASARSAPRRSIGKVNS